MKFIEYYFMLPNMKLLQELRSSGNDSGDELLIKSAFEERIYHTTLGTAFFGFIAWFTPELKWK